jgi:diguanylate cyclase (GGDEF)-like protein/PAS domain S-box-containing protein
VADTVRKSPTAAIAIAPATILIVDDEVKSRKLLGVLLKSEGYRTLTAADGAGALALIAEHRPDLILLDVLMPGMNGFEVARLLKANPATASIPIIMVTAQVDRSSRLAGLNAGAEEFLTKPFDKTELMLRVRNVLRMSVFSEFLENNKELVEQHVEQQVQALRASELSYRRLFQTAQDGILILDAFTGRVSDVNPFLITLLGFTFDEMVGKTVGELSPFKDIAANENMLELLQRDGYVRYEDLPLETRDGRQIAVEFVSNVYQAGDRKVIQCNIRDISERKRVAMELLGSERRFSDLLRNVELAAVMLDGQGHITFCNEYVLRLTGWRFDEIVGRDYFEVFVPAEYGDSKNFSARLLTLPEAWVRENEITTRSGERRRMRWSNSLLRSGKGDVIGSASIGEDITEQREATALLTESEHRLALATESARIGIWDWNVAADKMLWDPQMYELYGIRAQDFSGAVDAWQNGLHLESRERAEAEITAALDGSKDFHTEFRIVWPNNEVRDIEAHAVVQRDDHGNATRMTGVNWDITARKKAASRIIHLNRVYAVLSGINTLIVRVRDRDELFREACGIAVAQGGFLMSMICVVDRQTMAIVPVASSGKDDELLTSINNILSSPEAASKTMLALAVRERKVVISNDSQSDPRLTFGKQYAARAVRSIAVLPLIVADQVIGVISLFAGEVEFFHAEEMKLLTELAGDIAFAIDHIEKVERLEYLAYYDALTGLANRSLFLERLAQFMRSAASAGHKLAVGLIDLERFKNINDSLGRPAGDKLLTQVAQWMTHSAGDASLLARVDADHFAIVLPRVSKEGDVVRLLEKKRQAFLDHAFILNDTPFRIAIKVGVALFPDDGTDADTLFKHAEAALKRAKGMGEPYLFYTQKMTAAVAGRLTMENQLRQALENEEFVLYYQPKVHTLDGKLTGVEALIRWNDPRTGLVPPLRFIPVLEETGLIHEVGRWALRKAIEDYVRWRSTGLAAVRVAVNVSPLQLRRPNFIAETKRKIDIDPNAHAGLELEVTESVIMEDVQHNIAILQAIREMGIRIAIDDFGTGFSSLSYLSKLPVDSLKIDRSFVNEMTGSPQGLALVSTIISLAHALKLKVVAEGVETEDQSRLLRLIGCDEMQGYLFSKPLPVEVFETRYLTPHPKE